MPCFVCFQMFSETEKTLSVNNFIDCIIYVCKFYDVLTNQTELKYKTKLQKSRGGTNCNPRVPQSNIEF